MDERAEQLARIVIGAAIEVHRPLGPGYLENIYEQALAVELEIRGVTFKRQFGFSLTYKGRPVGEGRLDLLIEDCRIVELKSVETLTPLHTAQVISYLKGTGYRLGLLINFNVKILASGLKRVVL
jgi:GxxExxY protein